MTAKGAKARPVTVHAMPLGTRVFWLAMAVGLVSTLAGLAYLPTRTYFDQRTQVREREVQLASLRAERREADRRIEQLRSGVEVERMARQEYGMVMPGEEAYALLPTPRPIPEVVTRWPFRLLPIGAEPTTATPPPTAASTGPPARD